MSRITGRSTVAPLDPFKNISTGVPSQGYSAIPATGTQPTTGVGFFEPDLKSCVGQKFDTSDGRELVLVENGAVALSAGQVIQAPAEVTGHEGLAMTVPTAYPATAGLFQIYVTNGATVLNVNAFQGGYAIVSTGTGIGQILKIASHGPAANAGKFVVNLEDPIQTTLDATSKITLAMNPYKGVIATTGSTATSGPVGVTLYGIGASTAATFNGTTGVLTANGVAQYGLLVCHGPAGCLVDTVTAVGYPLSVSTAVAGAVSTGAVTGSIVGNSMQTLTSARTGFIYVTL